MDAVFDVTDNAVTCPLKDPETCELPCMISEPVIRADPVNGNAGAYEALNACVANEAVPCKDPVNPPVAITLPVICTCDPEAKIKFDLKPSAVPLPTIKADCADEAILYCP